MAKGLRASVLKANKAKLRATVFGPAADERTKRLSAKLQEIISRPKDAEMADTDFNIIDNKGRMNTEEEDKELDIDEQPGAKSDGGKSSNKVRKRNRRKKTSSITFKPHPGKLKRLAKKK
ncbi:hypothetical protein VTO42DRAFT_675 [Malbranchea cinnamomea]